MRKLIFLLIIFCSAAIYAGGRARIIFDTDMGGDYDDIGALAVLNALADAGECEILGVVSSTRHSPALGMCEIVNAHYGRTNVLMGACREIGVSVERDMNGVCRIFKEMVAERRSSLRYPLTEAAGDANEVYRRILASQSDGSVTLCTVGFTTNVRRLLETKGDDISPLSGRELVAKKVKAWYQMGGVLPKGLECNLRMDAKSSSIALRDFPRPVYLVDFNLGVDVYTGLPVAGLGIENGPVSEAFIRCFTVWNERRRGRPSWDEITVLAAVRGWENDFTLESGTMTVDPASGSNFWVKAEGGKHNVLVEKTPKAKLREIIDELMAREPLGRKGVKKISPKPFVWWHWCGTAVSKDGIIRDLDAMKKSGIGGATIFQVTRGPCSEFLAHGYDDNGIEDLEFGNDRWWEYVAFAVKEAKKRGLVIGMHNCPGYTVSGGPWITPDLAMKKLVWTSAPRGGTPQKPAVVKGFYRDIGTVERDGVVYRFGYTCTGSQCMPVAKSLFDRCLEADKMSAKAINHHLDHILAKDVGLDFILMDSYEAGPYDWTDDFRDEFKRRRGYDPLPHLPAYVGAQVEGAEKIKADMKKTVAELSTERHYRVFSDRLHEKGMKFILEPYGGPFDHCEAAWLSDVPTTEFWGARPFWVKPGFVGALASTGGAVGRAAGRNILAAEAYTAMPFDDPYVLAPRDFKAYTDASFARGVNHMFLHHWVHQPFPACRKPGMNMGYWGAHFGENQTWFEPGKEFFSYLERCQRLLQQGEEVIDVLAVEDVGEYSEGADLIPLRIFQNGVDFKDGRVIVRKSARAYGYLWVPKALRDQCDPQINAAVRAGVKMIEEGDNLPKRPFAVVGGVDCDINGPVLGTARALKDGRMIFFVANISSNNVEFTADFRARGRIQLWYPSTNEREDVSEASFEGGCSRLKMQLAAQESVFVLFNAPEVRAAKNRIRTQLKKPLKAAWKVSFEKNRGVDVAEISMKELKPLSESEDFSVRHFSGTATYRTKFNLSREDSLRLKKISLGEVRDIARVRLNGVDLGTAWYEPFAVAAGGAAREGENLLEIEVTNGWHNRLLGDKALPDDCEWGPIRYHQCDLDGSKGFCGRGLKRIPDWAWDEGGGRPSSGRITFTSWDYFKGDEKLRRSGLLGPVELNY